MRKNSKLLQLRRKRKVWYNFYIQIWFKYHSLFFGSLIINGKKLTAFFQFLKIKQGLKLRESYDPYFLFLVALMRATPNLVLMPIRLGGSSQGVPMPITEKKRIIFGVKWSLKILKEKKIGFSVNNIVDILLSSIYSKSVAIEKRTSVHKAGSRNRHLLKFFKI